MVSAFRDVMMSVASVALRDVRDFRNGTAGNGNFVRTVSFHSIGSVDSGVLGYDTMRFHRWLLAARRNTLP